MSDIAIIAQAVGFLVQTVGLLTVAVRTGSWKGQLDIRVKALEKQTQDTVKELHDTVKELHDVDKRVDGVEKELLKIMVGVQKDIEYIKRFVDKQSVGQPVKEQK